MAYAQTLTNSYSLIFYKKGKYRINLSTNKYNLEL
jgi:hypothetical protein